MQFELTKAFIEDLKDAIERADEGFLLEHLADLHPADVAEILDEVKLSDAQFIYKILDEEKAADVLIELDEDVREKFLGSMSSKEIAEQFIDNLDSDDAAKVISELPEEQRAEVISHIEDLNQASDIVALLKYPEGTAGSLMAKELIAVNENWSVLKSAKEMRRQAELLDFVYTVYVVNNKEQLVGTLSLKRMLLTPASTEVSKIYEGDVISVKATEKEEEVAHLMQKYDLVVLPVVDDMNRLLGRITIDDVVDVMREEAEKDYQMASGLSESVESSDKVLTMTRARLPWLLVGLLGGIFGAQVIGSFEVALEKIPTLAFFIPLIAAMGGNVGVQSSAIIVQGLANNSLGMDSWMQRLRKELLVAIVNGIICSAIIFAYNLLFNDDIRLAHTVGLALMSVIMFAALFGTFVPLILNKYRVDPALATGPFITTVNDVLGLAIYFLIAISIYGI